MRRMYSKSQIVKIIDEHGGGGGAVDSVNGKTGTVVLKASDIDANNAQTIQNNLERLDTRIDDLAYITDVGDGIDLTEGILSADFDTVQPKLTAGANITISGNVISATAGEDRGVSDVIVDGESVVEDGVANIDLSTKLDATKSAVASVGGLVVPTVAPANTRLVAVDTTNAQAQITIGSGLSLSGTTSPYTLSATGTNYTAGFGIDINNGVISAKCGKGIMTNTQGQLTIRRGIGLIYDQYDAIEPDFTVVQQKLTAGTNITIDPVTNVISSTGGGGGSYTAGDGIDITNSEISVDCGKGLKTDTQGKLTIDRGLGLKYDANDALEPDYDYVQRKLTAGANIYIDPTTNVISAMGSEGIVTDVKINNESVVDGYGVANIPIAGVNTLGAVQVWPYFGITKNEDGIIYPNAATDTDLQSESPYMAITSGNYVNALREGFKHTTNWTAQDKAVARQCIEASKVERKVTSIATDPIEYISIDHIDYKIKDTKYTAGSGITLNGTTFSTVIPNAPTTNGVYDLRCTVTNGNPTYSWVPAATFTLSGTNLAIQQ